MQGVILAAGRGTRLLPVTQVRSKAMAPVAGRPMIDWIMETMVANQVREFVLVVAAGDSEIRRYYPSESALDVEVRFVVQEERLGSAHALGLAAPFIDGDVLVSACDSLKSAAHIGELIQQHRRQQAQATLSLQKVAPARISATGIVEWRDGRVRLIVEKPALDEAPSNIASLPLYLFTPALLNTLPRVRPSVRGEYELPDAIQMLIDDGAMVTGVFAAQRRQITTIDDLLTLNRQLLQEVSTAPVACYPGVTLIPPLIVAEDVKIGVGATVGPYVNLERGCQIGENATIRDAIVLRNSSVAAGSSIISQVVST